MKRILLSSLVLCLALVGAATASAQTTFYCVKPDGAPVAGIVIPSGRHDPSVLCNAMVPQCFLTCGAVLQLQNGQAVAPPDLPMVTVTPQMLNSMGSPAYESPQQCASQYQQCLAKCRGDQACKAYCESVRSGCGTGNRGQ
jgi:hypothetical protein